MSIKLNLSYLPEELKAPVLDECAYLGIAVADDGAPLRVRPGDKIAAARENGEVILTYRAKNEIFRALTLIGRLPEGYEISQDGKFDLLCYMADASRNAVFSVAGAKKMIRVLAAAGYNGLMLYTEDTYEVPGYKYFGHMRGRFSEAELKEIDDYAFSFGIEVIPCIQTLAHLSTAIRWPGLSSFSDTGDILLAGDERTYAFVRACLETCRRVFRSRRINIGMDEAHSLGLGRYLKKNGYTPAPEIMLAHLGRVAALCEEVGLAPMMWSDMFFRMAFGGSYYTRDGEIAQEIMDKVPANVTLVYWDYYSLDRQRFDHMIDCHLKFNNPVAFAGGAWKWSGFAPHNNFSLVSTKLQLDSCAERGVGNVIVTGWGDNGGEASQFSTLPTLLYYAERLYAGAGVEPTEESLRLRSREVYGAEWDDLLLFDLPNSLPGTEVGKISHPVNPCKYLLYNDVLEGLLDCHLDANAAPFYADAAAKLLAHKNDANWGYIFHTLGALCDVLSLKADLGVRLTAAYRAGDRKVLAKIAYDEIPNTIAKLDEFLSVFRTQWYAENKTFGFATEEQRLGGLRQRLLSAAARIAAYLAGEAEKIEELEQPRLPVDGRAADDPRTPYISYNSWGATSTACIV